MAGGNYTHRVLARGTELRLTDLRGDACAHLLLYVADRPWERLNAADTVKVQWNAYLGAGRAAPLRPGPRPRLGRRRHLAAATTPCAAPPPSYATPSGTGTAPRSPPPPPAASCSSSPPPRTASSPATCRPRSPSSRAWRYGEDGTLDFTGSAGPGAIGDPARRAGRDRADRERAAPGRPAPRVRQHPAGGAGLARRPDRGPATRCGTPPPRAAAPSSTPPTSSPRGGSHDHDRRSRPRRLVAVVRAGETAHHHRPARQPGRRLPRVRRPRHRRPLQRRPTPSTPRAASSSPPAAC